MEDREVVLIIDSFVSSFSIPQCRICHEEEEEIGKSNKLEAPCTCSGTVKFAHRECIQRWCNEKGNTTCEICLQEFEPGYSAPATKDKVNDVSVTIRGSLLVPIQTQEELNNPGLRALVELDSNYSDCSSAADTSSSCFRFVTITFTIFLLVRHLLYVLTNTTEHYAFTLLTVLVLRAIGILIPIYVMVRAVEAIQNMLQQLHQEAPDEPSNLLGGEEERTPIVQVFT